MNLTIPCGARFGSVSAPPSKSDAHRKLICAALADAPSVLRISDLSDDIAATVRCLCAFGASIRKTEGGLSVTPISAPPHSAVLNVGESGSTLRFLLPVCGALGVSAQFDLSGRLPQRPMEPLFQALRENGMRITPENGRIFCSGRLRGGTFSLPGDVSSQFLSGLLFALPLPEKESILRVSLPMVSAPYFEMTKQTVSASLLRPLFFKESQADGAQSYYVNPSNVYHVSALLPVEGDWSGAAAFFCMGALSESGIAVCGLSPDSMQPDRAVLDVLASAGAEIEMTDAGIRVRKGALRAFSLDAAPCPDLVPVLAVFACACEGTTRIFHTARLRQKESDRLFSVSTLINALGGIAEVTDDALLVTGRSLHGGTVSSFSDHRIAFAAAVAACMADAPVMLEGAEAVRKSYPCFWRDLESLKGANQ